TLRHPGRWQDPEVRPLNASEDACTGEGLAVHAAPNSAFLAAACFFRRRRASPIWQAECPTKWFTRPLAGRVPLADPRKRFQVARRGRIYKSLSVGYGSRLLQ